MSLLRRAGGDVEHADAADLEGRGEGVDGVEEGREGLAGAGRRVTRTCSPGRWRPRLFLDGRGSPDALREPAADEGIEGGEGLDGSGETLGGQKATSNKQQAIDNKYGEQEWERGGCGGGRGRQGQVVG